MTIEVWLCYLQAKMGDYSAKSDRKCFFPKHCFCHIEEFIDWWHHPVQNSVTTKNPVPSTTAIQLLCPQAMGNKTTGEAENALSSARRINYGVKTLFNSVDSTGKDVPIPTSVPTLRLLLCTAHQVCTCYPDCFHHITQEMLMLFSIDTFSTTNKQPITTHWN